MTVTLIVDTAAVDEALSELKTLARCKATPSHLLRRLELLELSPDLAFEPTGGLLLRGGDLVSVWLPSAELLAILATMRAQP